MFLRNLVLASIVLLVTTSVVKADRDLGMIDKNDSYNIYYAGSEHGSSLIVKRVKIVRIEQINGVDFLVFISESGFNAKAKEGFIVFDTIRAIVPDSTFVIVGEERLK